MEYVEYGHFDARQARLMTTRDAEKLQVFRHRVSEYERYAGMEFLYRFFDALVKSPDFISVKRFELHKDPQGHGDILEVLYKSFSPADVSFDTQLTRAYDEAYQQLRKRDMEVGQLKARLEKACFFELLFWCSASLLIVLLAVLHV